MKKSKTKLDFFLETQKLSALENEVIKGGYKDSYENIICKDKNCPHWSREQQ